MAGPKKERENGKSKVSRKTQKEEERSKENINIVDKIEQDARPTANRCDIAVSWAVVSSKKRGENMRRCFFFAKCFFKGLDTSVTLFAGGEGRLFRCQ